MLTTVTLRLLLAQAMTVPTAKMTMRSWIKKDPAANSRVKQTGSWGKNATAELINSGRRSTWDASRLIFDKLGSKTTATWPLCA